MAAAISRLVMAEPSESVIGRVDQVLTRRKKKGPP